MLVYIISSKDEQERITHVSNLGKIFPGLVQIEAIYPSKIKIPFINDIKKVSKKRTGTGLSDGAIGCLLSHRKIWHQFLQQNTEAYCLILESDSEILSVEKINEYYQHVQENFDLFFWGAFDGRMKLFKTSKTKINNYFIGVPFIKSIYCTYGYMVNKKAAAFLLKQTNKINYPIDYFKYRLKNTNLRIGGIIPNLITTKPTFVSTIYRQKESFFKYIFNKIIDLKNIIITKFN